MPEDENFGPVLQRKSPKTLPAGCYTMLQLTTDLQEKGDLDVFEDVGGREFLVP